jgi:hypothetical protein
MRPFQKHFFRFHYSILDSLLWVLREVVISHNELMELVPQVVGTSSSTMSIIDGKEGAPRPLVNLLELGLDDV